MKVGFTGTRKGMTSAQKHSLRMILLSLKCNTFSHGDCVGADEEAHAIAGELGAVVVVHPPINDKLRAYVTGNFILETKPVCDYLVRNKHIVDSTEHLIATPETYTSAPGSGTWGTIRYARKIGRPRTIILPDGTCKDEASPASHR